MLHDVKTKCLTEWWQSCDNATEEILSLILKITAPCLSSEDRCQFEPPVLLVLYGTVSVKTSDDLKHAFLDYGQDILLILGVGSQAT